MTSTSPETRDTPEDVKKKPTPRKKKTKPKPEPVTAILLDKNNLVYVNCSDIKDVRQFDIDVVPFTFAPFTVQKPVWEKGETVETGPEIQKLLNQRKSLIKES